MGCLGSGDSVGCGGDWGMEGVMEGLGCLMNPLLNWTRIDYSSDTKLVLFKSLESPRSSEMLIFMVGTLHKWGVSTDRCVSESKSGGMVSWMEVIFARDLLISFSI